LPAQEEVADLTIRVDRPIAADENGAELAVSTQADAAFHIALQRDVDAFPAHSTLLQLRHRKAHHHLRPADQRHRALRIEARSRDQARDDADTAAPVHIAPIHRDGHVEIQPAAPSLYLMPVEELVWR